MFYTKTPKNRFTILFLLLIVLLGTLLRTWKLTSLPLPPNGDETAFGYYGWSLLHFGTDEYGNRFPLYFPSIGDYKYPTLAYLNTIPALIFGLSEITIRFWSVLSGIILIPIIFVISYLIFKSKVAALFSSLFVALAPWSITLSRVGYETNTGIALTSLAIISLLLANSLGKNEKILPYRLSKKTINKLIFISFVLFLLSSFCYGAQRVFIPLFLFLVLLTSIKTEFINTIKRKLIILFILTTAIIFISLIPPQSRGRASGVIYKGASLKDIQYSIHLDGISPIKTPIIVTRIFHNKINFALIDFANRYASYFDPNFIFFKGDLSPETTHQVGIILLIELLFLPLGIIFSAKDKNTYKVVAFVWMLAGPAAASLTEGGPHLVRASIMFPIFALFSGYGASYLINMFKSKLKSALAIIIILSAMFNGGYVVHQILVHKPVKQPWYSDQGKKEMVLEVLKLKDKYKAVAITNDPYVFFLYYGKITPSQFISDSDITIYTKQNQWERVNRFSNIYFKMPWDCPKGGKLNVLYVCKGENIPQNARVIKAISFEDKVPVYTLIEFFPFSQSSANIEPLPQFLKYMVEKETKYPDGIIPEDYPSLW